MQKVRSLLIHPPKKKIYMYICMYIYRSCVYREIYERYKEHYGRKPTCMTDESDNH